MTRGRLAPRDRAADLVERIERAGGKAVPGEVLELCALFRALACTVRAQKEILADHARTIGELRQKEKS